jgi:ribosome-associated toxin RatA of RatAB toxin-antitoxin module
MAVIQRNARVPYSADQMLALVNDIDAYPEFLHWCHAARVEQTQGPTVDAALEIGISGIYKTIRTRNTTLPADESGRPATIRIEMVQGPLKSLNGAWRFAATPDGGCDVELYLEYEVHLSPLGLILRSLFDEIANSQLNAFVRRARAVYGNT